MPRERESRWMPVGFAWTHSVANAYFCVAQQLRICFCDSESQLLLDVLLGGGSSMRVTIEFSPLVLLFPFYARRWDNAQGAGVPCGELMHSGCVGSVGPEHQRVWGTGSKQKLIEHRSPFPMGIDWHRQQDDSALD